MSHGYLADGVYLIHQQVEKLIASKSKPGQVKPKVKPEFLARVLVCDGKTLVLEDYGRTFANGLSTLRGSNGLDALNKSESIKNIIAALRLNPLTTLTNESQITQGTKQSFVPELSLADGPELRLKIVGGSLKNSILELDGNTAFLDGRRLTEAEANSIETQIHGGQLKVKEVDHEGLNKNEQLGDTTHEDPNLSLAKEFVQAVSDLHLTPGQELVEVFGLAQKHGNYLYDFNTQSGIRYLNFYAWCLLYWAKFRHLAPQIQSQILAHKAHRHFDDIIHLVKNELESVEPESATAQKSLWVHLEVYDEKVLRDFLEKLIYERFDTKKLDDPTSMMFMQVFKVSENSFVLGFQDSMFGAEILNSIRSYERKELEGGRDGKGLNETPQDSESGLRPAFKDLGFWVC